MSQGREVWQLRSALPAKLTQASEEEEEGERSESAQARAGTREAQGGRRDKNLGSPHAECPAGMQGRLCSPAPCLLGSSQPR